MIKKEKNSFQIIVSFEKENNYPYLILHVLKNYASILETYGDPYLDLIIDIKDKESLMNVDLGYFISTENQLNIFIEALELYFKEMDGFTMLKMNSLQYELIKELIDKLKEKKFLKKRNFIKKIFEISFFVLSPLYFYTFFKLVQNFIPITLIHSFLLYLFYNAFKFLIPFFKEKKYLLGIYCLFRRIVIYIWSQKFFLGLIYLIPNFSFLIASFNSLKNCNFILCQMVPFSNLSKNKALKSFIDITTSIKLIKLNPILNKENLFKNKTLPGSILIRSWIRTPRFYKKFIGQALEWEYLHYHQKGPLWVK